MKLRADHKKMILDEFGYAVRTMREVKTFDEKLFYFSSTYGVLSRVFNAKFDPQLVFMHLVLSNAHSTFLARVQAMRSGDNAIQLSEDFFNKLTDLVDELAKRITGGKDTYDLLEKIGVLTYATTGNGYFLFRKGVFAI